MVDFIIYFDDAADNVLDDDDVKDIRKCSFITTLLKNETAKCWFT
jgi:hypothetical protein